MLSVLCSGQPVKMSASENNRNKSHQNRCWIVDWGWWLEDGLVARAWWLMASRWWLVPLVVGGWWLVAMVDWGWRLGWWFVVGCWLLMASRWWPVVGG